MPKVVYTSTQGLVQSTGAGVQFETMPVSPVQGKTEVSGSVSSPGNYTLSGSVANQIVMPLASSVPGGVFAFRAASADAHYLTGTLEAAGTKVFKAPVTGSGTQDSGSKIALTATVGSSVILQSDGKNFCVIGQTGQLTYSGT